MSSMITKWNCHGKGIREACPEMKFEYLFAIAHKYVRPYGLTLVSSMASNLWTLHKRKGKPFGLPFSFMAALGHITTGNPLLITLLYYTYYILAIQKF